MTIQDLPPYTYNVFKDEESGEYVAVCKEIPGLSGIGETRSEALAELKEAILGWLEVLQEKGLPILRPDQPEATYVMTFDVSLSMKPWVFIVYEKDSAAASILFEIQRSYLQESYQVKTLVDLGREDTHCYFEAWHTQQRRGPLGYLPTFAPHAEQSTTAEIQLVAPRL